MPSSRRGSPDSAKELKKSRKNPRRGATATVCYAGDRSDDDDGDDEEVGDDSSIVEMLSTTGENDDDLSYYEEEKAVVGSRRSVRNNKARVNMQEEDDDDDDDDNLIIEGKENDKENDIDESMPAARLSRKTSKAILSRAKSPARRGKKRPSIESTGGQTSEYSEVEESDESCSDEKPVEKQPKKLEPFKISKIIASRTELRSAWKDICHNMNTSELDYGSRWVQEQDPVGKSDDTTEERFLIKWTDLSYMHCSWETRKDLEGLIEGATTSFATFDRKKLDDGLIFDADERCDGTYFDPGWTQIDRILEIHFPEECPLKYVEEEDKVTHKDLGICLNMNDPQYTTGLGRNILIKWENRPYSELSWEFERDLVLNNIDYKSQLKALTKRTIKASQKDVLNLHDKGEAELRRLYKEVFGEKSDSRLEGAVDDFQKALAKYIYPNGGQLRDYQAEGVSWMIANYVNKRSSILADEMGLGKTIQLAAFLNHLTENLHIRGPFLIVVPLSTLCNWKRELDDWLGLNTVVYHGTAKNRQLIREYEMAYPSDRPQRINSNQLYLRKCSKAHTPTMGNQWMAEVVITTPELLCTEDFTELTAVKWECLVVDEAHRLKNYSSKFAVNLRDHKFEFRHKVLLTGTPIQNTMEELFALLNFVAPDLFSACDEFIRKYGDMKSKESVDELHEEIRPYILRRLKEDVEKSVPPKEETVIEVELTIAQKQYYRALYEKNVKFLHKNKKKPLDGPSLNNLAMQLRKCCNHLFLLNGIEEEYRAKQLTDGKRMTEGDVLVSASGKLVLLDKLLPRLKEDGHRLLIFSQFKIMLDVLEDYLHARDISFERIDGSITGKKRQQAIDRFQAPASEGKENPFVMLLSTRAGGVGINLTAADTCIIFDSDWNPQNDLQAQARCHRIGQTKSVKVYRLLTSKTYEMQMFHMSSLKLGLDQAVLSGFESGSKATLTKKDIERLLRHGAYSILNEEKDGTAEAASNDFVQQDIDTILERRSRTVVYENTGSGSAAAGGKFSKARFTTAVKSDDTSHEHSHDNIDVEDPDFWTKMLGEASLEEVSEVLGKRTRTVNNYCEEEYEKKIGEAIALDTSIDVDDEASRGYKGAGDNDSDDDDSFEEAEDSESESEDEEIFGPKVILAEASCEDPPGHVPEQS